MNSRSTVTLLLNTAKPMAWPKPLLLRLTLGLICSTAISTAAFADGLLCCKIDGHQVCGDTMPVQCRGKSYRQVDRSGNTLSEYDAALTPEQRQQRQAEQQRRSEEESRIRMQRRQDKALLDTYPNLDFLDKLRDRSIDQVNQRIKPIEDQLKVAKDKRQGIEQKITAAGQPTPKELNNALRDVDSEIRTSTGLLDARKRELDSVKERFDRDRKRYIELTGAGK